jgi:hypothetical protein
MSERELKLVYHLAALTGVVILYFKLFVTPKHLPEYKRRFVDISKRIKDCSEVYFIPWIACDVQAYYFRYRDEPHLVKYSVTLNQQLERKKRALERKAKVQDHQAAQMIDAPIGVK